LLNSSPQFNNPQLGNPQLNGSQFNNPQLNGPQFNNPQLGNPQFNGSQYGQSPLYDPKLLNQPGGGAFQYPKPFANLMAGQSVVSPDTDPTKIMRIIEQSGGLERTLPGMEKSLWEHEMRVLQQGMSQANFLQNSSNPRMRNMFPDPNQQNQRNMFSDPNQQNQNQQTYLSQTGLRPPSASSGGYPSINDNLTNSPRRIPSGVDERTENARRMANLRGQSRDGSRDRSGSADRMFNKLKHLRDEKEELLNLNVKI